MLITTNRPMELHDLDAMELPRRKTMTKKDGGSWTAEVYIDNRWATMTHDVATNTTTVNGKYATVETTFRISPAEQESETMAKARTWARRLAEAYEEETGAEGDKKAFSAIGKYLEETETEVPDDILGVLAACTYAAYQAGQESKG